MTKKNPMMESALYCIANPKAGGGKLKKHISDITSFFSENRIAYELIWTEGPRHGTQLAEQLANAGVQRLASLGGDGTAFEVINGILRSQSAAETALSILPLGTGNSFLRDYGITTWQEAARRLVAGSTRRVDAGRIEFPGKEIPKPVFFHNMAGFGLAAEACRLRHTRYSWMGRLAYHGAFLNLLPGLKSYSMRLRVDENREIVIQTPLLAINNSQYTGHNMHLSPLSHVEDGYFELLYAEGIKAGELFRLFLTLPTGRHIQHPKVQIKKAQRVDLAIDGIDYFMVDGEIVEGNTLRIEICPGALNILI